MSAILPSEINNIEPIAICTINEEDDNIIIMVILPVDDVDENNPPIKWCASRFNAWQLPEPPTK